MSEQLSERADALMLEVLNNAERKRDLEAQLEKTKADDIALRARVDELQNALNVLEQDNG